MVVEARALIGRRCPAVAAIRLAAEALDVVMLLKAGETGDAETES